MRRRLREIVRTTNASQAEPAPLRSKYAPKEPRKRLLRPCSENTRWLSEEVSALTMQLVARAGSQAALSERTGVHVTTIMRMLDGELVGLRTIALLANAAGVRFSLVGGTK